MWKRDGKRGYGGNDQPGSAHDAASDRENGAQRKGSEQGGHPEHEPVPAQVVGFGEEDGREMVELEEGRVGTVPVGTLVDHGHIGALARPLQPGVHFEVAVGGNPFAGDGVHARVPADGDMVTGIVAVPGCRAEGYHAHSDGRPAIGVRYPNRRCGTRPGYGGKCDCRQAADGKSNREVIYPEHGQEKADTADTDDARCDDHQAPLEPQWHQVRRSGPTRYINPTSRLIKHSRTHAVLWRDPAAPDGATHYPSVTFLARVSRPILS